MDVTYEQTTTLRASSKHHEPIVLESNQNHATVTQTGVSPTLPASMGMGGGYVPMVVEALPFDTTQVTSPMNWSVPRWGDACHPLAAEQHHPAVVIRESGETMENHCTDAHERGCSWDGKQISPTLTARNAGGGQRMPDKENFTAVLAYGLDRASYNQGKNAKYDFSVERELIGAQVAKGPGAVEIEGGDAMTSVVRRLTPLE